MSMSLKDLRLFADWLQLQSVNQSNNVHERRKFAHSAEWIQYWLESKKLDQQPHLHEFVVDCLRNEMESFERLAHS